MLTDKKIQRRKISISGIVQGVGFRPFIFNLALKNNLSGFVLNNRLGVEVEAEGEVKSLDSFILSIKNTSPPLSDIDNIQVTEIGLKGEGDFRIVETKTDSENETTLISPDYNVCPDCLRELFDPKDRRFEYPFINCTNCGPRYTIIEGTPYDRSLTSMKGFEMCEECSTEYKSPIDRRFHAQPNACQVCGPSLFLLDKDGKKLRSIDPISEAVSQLKTGKILAIKGIGGYHLVCDAANEEAVSALRERKYRKNKPLAIMSPDIETIERYASAAERERRIIIGRERPIVLVNKLSRNNIAPSVAPHNRYFGVMLPYTPIHYLLFSVGNGGYKRPFHFEALVMTSGNVANEPISFNDGEALERLGGIADYFLVHNREIVWRCDDSVIQVIKPSGKGEEIVSIIRRSRGFVPSPIFIKNTSHPLLACGGDLKNTFALADKNRVFLGPHIGDLEHSQAYYSFQQSIEHYKKIFRIEPEYIVVDKHPGYFSSRYGREYGRRFNKPVIEVQHHHAHIASVMAEHGLDGEVIGLAMDGTGYGDDDTIWGGEVLGVSYPSFTRLGHIKPIPLPGGDMAAKEPWRVATAILYRLYGEDLCKAHPRFAERIGEKRIAPIIAILKGGINSPLSSGLGRYFDAAASLLGIEDYNTFEGEAPIKLEMIADIKEGRIFKYGIEKNGEINLDPMVRELIEWGAMKQNIASASAIFHNTISAALVDSCQDVRREYGLNRVCLSGGVFQNRFLLTKIISSLESCSFSVFTPVKTPMNDGGIALGEAVVALNRVKEKNR